MGHKFIAILLLAFLFCSFNYLNNHTTRVSSTTWNDSSLPDTIQLGASAISIVPVGNRSVLTINKGISHNVKVGDQGFIPELNNRPIKVTEVYPVRCKAVMDTLVEKTSIRVILIIQKEKK